MEGKGVGGRRLEGSGVGLAKVQVMGGRRGFKESRKELNLLQTPLNHGIPLLNIIMPSGKNCVSVSLECDGVFFRHVVACVFRLAELSS